MDLNQCPCSGKTMTRLLQPAMMALLANEPLHGYRLVQQLSSLKMLRGKRPDPTGVYRVLKWMEQKKYVKSEWDLTEHGPAKRRYILTALGRRCLTQWGKTLQEHKEAVSDLLRMIKDRPCPRKAACCGNASPS